MLVADVLIDFVWAHPSVSKSDQPDLNRRAEQLIGRVLLLEEAIEAAAARCASAIRCGSPRAPTSPPAPASKSPASAATRCRWSGFSAPLSSRACPEDPAILSHLSSC